MPLSHEQIKEFAIPIFPATWKGMRFFSIRLILSQSPAVLMFNFNTLARFWFPRFAGYLTRTCRCAIPSRATLLVRRGEGEFFCGTFWRLKCPCPTPHPISLYRKTSINSHSLVKISCGSPNFHDRSFHVRRQNQHFRDERSHVRRESPNFRGESSQVRRKGPNFRDRSSLLRRGSPDLHDGSPRLRNESPLFGRESPPVQSGGRQDSRLDCGRNGAQRACPVFSGRKYFSGHTPVFVRASCNR